MLKRMSDFFEQINKIKTGIFAIVVLVAALPYIGWAARGKADQQIARPRQNTDAIVELRTMITAHDRKPAHDSSLVWRAEEQRWRNATTRKLNDITAILRCQAMEVNTARTRCYNDVLFQRNGTNGGER